MTAFMIFLGIMAILLVLMKAEEAAQNDATSRTPPPMPRQKDETHP